MPYSISDVTFENSSGVTGNPSQKDGAWDDGNIIHFRMKFTGITKNLLQDVISFKTDLAEMIGSSNSKVFMLNAIVNNGLNLASGNSIQLADQNLSGTQKLNVSVSTGFLSATSVTIILEGYILIT